MFIREVTVAKRNPIDNKKHYIIEFAHPSPLSAYRGFLKLNLFLKPNQFLKTINKKEIKW